MIDREDVPGKGVACERCEERVDEWRPWKRGLDGAVIHLDCLLRQRVFIAPDTAFRDLLRRFPHLQSPPGRLDEPMSDEGKGDVNG